MKISKPKKYNLELKEILKYIAKGSPISAKSFKVKLDKKILDLPHMPYKFRQSIYFDYKQIRDLIYKGYTIPYLVDEQKQAIVLLGIISFLLVVFILYKLVIIILYRRRGHKKGRKVSGK